MRKYLLSLLLILSIGSIASAQQSGNYAGGSTGYPHIIAAHYGFAELFGSDIDLRLSASFSLQNVSGMAATGGTLTGDALFHFRSGGLSAPYAGGGLTLGIGSVAGGASGFMWDIHGLGGYQYQLNPDLSAFGELSVGFRSYHAGGHSLSGLGLGLRVGANYYF